MRLGVLGGTFDPIHNGHLAAARAAGETLSLDAVVLVPAGRPWHRTSSPSATAQQRLEMTERAAETHRLFRVSDVDIRRSGPTYAVDMLADIAVEFPGAELFLILGEDAFRGLPSWKQPERIASLAHLVVVERSAERGTQSAFEAGEPDTSVDSAGAHSLAEVGADVTRVALSGYDISATDIRRRCAAGEPIAQLVPAAVQSYIAEHKLYR